MKTPPKKLTNRDAANLFFALKLLNGAPKAVFDPKTGRDVEMREPYGFSSQLTMQIAKNLSELRRRLDEYNVAVDLIAKDDPERQAKLKGLLDVEVDVSLTVLPYASLRVGEKPGENRIDPELILNLMAVIDE